jgi:hypothetical protein
MSAPRWVVRLAEHRIAIELAKVPKAKTGPKVIPHGWGVTPGREATGIAKDARSRSRKKDFATERNCFSPRRNLDATFRKIIQ